MKALHRYFPFSTFTPPSPSLIPGIAGPFFTKFLNLPEKYFIAFLAPTWIASGNGRTWRSPTGEIALSEIQIVFVKVSICPETMRSHLESLRETHFGATATRFESAAGFPPIPGGSSVGTFFRGHEKWPQKSLVSTPRVRWGEQGRQHGRRPGF